MNAEIISVGDELQRGEIINTNAAFLAKQLNQFGILVSYQTTVGDNPQQIEESVRNALHRVKLLFVCGGLGPTTDDVTLHSVAKALNEKVKTDEETWQKLLAIFKQRQIPVQKENKRQAQYIGALIPNLKGLALGSWYQKGSKRVIILPGPPSEFQSMVLSGVLPRLKNEVGVHQVLKTRALHFLGRPESTLMKELQPVIERYPEITVTSYVKPTNIEVRLTTLAPTDEEAAKRFEMISQEILEKEQPYFIGEGSNFSLVHKVVSCLKKRHLTVTGAESLTGGLFQSTICSVPGASEVFAGGFVTYAATAKEKLLEIPAALINQHGVVSSATAQAMAEQSRQKLGADIGLSFTGVAGPDGLEGQAAGTVWLGLAIKGQPTVTKELHLAGYLGRQAIRTLSVQYGLQMILLALEK